MFMCLRVRVCLTKLYTYIRLCGCFHGVKLEMSSVTIFYCSLHLYLQGRCCRTTVVDLACDLIYQVCR